MLSCKQAGSPEALDHLSYHVPVLLKEAVGFLNVYPGGIYVDATLGGGSHSRAILENLGPEGRLISIDRDPEAIAWSRQMAEKSGGRCTLIQANYSHLNEVLSEVSPVNGILFDLGVSSHQLDTERRGFSFRFSGPLDMRMGPDADLDAGTLLRTWSEDELARIFRDYGEERHARRIASAIVKERHNILTTWDLAELVRKVSPAPSQSSRIDAATKVFQALRLAVNAELDGLKAGLNAAVECLAPGGRLVVIAYHSLEDRIVKTFLKEQSAPCICLPDLPRCACGRIATMKTVTGKPVRPSEAEIAANPRSRSARLRVGERLSRGR
ncbi:MAG: 16S rRNA (cytosine(1402)-N(4))-methyltransferase RsmH [Armatimonadetes bacterium]|nr:16S rRNA (cytosine(1402)-N(4))-methyltransferase RsmH [Armatimonadota bacterium]